MEEEEIEEVVTSFIPVSEEDLARILEEFNS